MFYDAELSFLQAILKNLQLNPILISPQTYDMTNIDRGFRGLLGLKEEYQLMNQFIQQKIKGNTIYKAKDSFFCNYIFLQLPYTESTSILMIGPFTTIEITKHSLMQLTEKYTIPAQFFSAIEKYYLSIPLWHYQGVLDKGDQIILQLNTYKEGMTSRSFTY